ncbi:uncharacterized protein JN550_004635 [Neoarthrinium moseri]|uniref:uncharacterized protein n=1 Tax=Neoarthrinium moseri TaxID=1658444 RepID=UPI001FDAEA86|nr:uncharacterized protein JN550_004635 [Neoarthrinium moseri]KAI1871190.1 hypothetical protein JN550_004635 [Neoarthrinium moseri]
MSIKTAATIFAGLLACQTVSAYDFTISSGNRNYTKDSGPYRVSGKDMKAALANPFASHNWTAAGPNGTSDYTYTITVADINLNDTAVYKNKTMATADAIISLSAPAGANLTDWKVNHKIYIPEYNQTWIDLFKPSDNGDCKTALSDACLAKLTSKPRNGSNWPEECPPTNNMSSFAWNSTASSVVNADAWVNYYSRPHDASNKTLVEKLSKQVFPILLEWNHAKTNQSVRSMRCVRATVPSPSPNPGTTTSSTSGPTSSATAPPTTTATSAPASTTSPAAGIAGLNAAVRKDYLLGAAALVAGYMAC